MTPKAIAAAKATAKFKGNADLHSMAAWENMFILKDVMESEKILAKPDTVQADRRKIRDGLAKLKTTEGLLGDDEARGPRGREAVRIRAGEGRAVVVLHNPL